MLGNDAPADVTDAPAHTIGRDDPQLAVGQLLDQHRRPRGVAALLEFARDRDDVAVADAADLHDLHTVSIYRDSRAQRSAPQVDRTPRAPPTPDGSAVPS